MSSRTGSAAAAAVLVLAVVLVLVGRWEGRRDARHVNAEIAAVRQAVGPLGARSLSGFRLLPGFDCLTYARGRLTFALELCVDRSGRVVEAIDRRGGHRRFWTLQFDPGAATVRVSRAEVDRLLRKMEAA